MKLTKLFLLFIPLLAVTAYCQSKKSTTPAPAVGSPEWLVKMYFVEPNPPDLKGYLGGDMLKEAQDPPMGSIAPEWVKISYRPVEITPERAIYAVTYVDSTDTRDVYCYINKSGSTWKIMTTLWMATYEIYRGPISELSAKKNLNDSLQMNLDHMKLSVASDSSLRAFFKAHRRQLDSLLVLTKKFAKLFMLRTRCSDKGFEPEYGGLYPIVCPMIHAAKVWAIYHGTDACPAGTFFELGGYQENTVGFLYVPQGAAPPRMSSDRYFLIDPIAPHWYLYKTD